MVRISRLPSAVAVLTVCLVVVVSPVQAQQITGLVLVNADTDTDIRPLSDNEIIDVDRLPTNQLSLRASVDNDAAVLANNVSFVRFLLNGVAQNRERVPPYSAGGDRDGNFAPMELFTRTGQLLVDARSYQFDSATGSDVEVSRKSWALQIFVANATTTTTTSATTTPATTGTATTTSIPITSTTPPTTTTDATGTQTTSTTPSTTTDIISNTTVPISDVPAYSSCTEGCLSASGVSDGTIRIWHKMTVGFHGPLTNEQATPNPFTDYRLDVLFFHVDSGSSFVVPGYYAGDGNAANSQLAQGNVWLAHFAPDQEGTWHWQAAFVRGPKVAMYEPTMFEDERVSAGFFDGQRGNFTVEPTDKEGRDFRCKGRLEYVQGKHHLQHVGGDREWFLKAGADSPENFLAYEGFDNTPNYGGRRKSWAPHVQDFMPGDPTWAGGKGKGIIGAINYLAAKGMNAFSFLTMNIQGDDENVFPYVSEQPGDHRLRMDNSKLAQWEIVFEHADKLGLFLHFKTQETENDKLLDEGLLGDERRFYYRELVARFSHHLALNWNLGEENRNQPAQRKEFADYWKQVDPYLHPVVMHTFPTRKDRDYAPLLGFEKFDGVSLQSGWEVVFNDTLKWRQASDDAGKTWVVCNDEQGPAGVGVVPDGDPRDPSHDVVRHHVLWGNIMAGGAGVEYYFGYRFHNSDLTCEDFRSRDAMWDQSRFALEFFGKFKIPFWNMASSNERVSNGWCLSDETLDTLVLYLWEDPQGIKVNLSGSADYFVRWYNPITGGNLQLGSEKTVPAGESRSIGVPPAAAAANNDWVVLLRRKPQLPNTTTSQPVPELPVPEPLAVKFPTAEPSKITPEFAMIAPSDIFTPVLDSEEGASFPSATVVSANICQYIVIGMFWLLIILCTN